MNGKIFYVMGKSASGKDTIYKCLRQRLPQMGQVVMYTTRPMRDGEKNGREYFFTDRTFLERVRKEGRLIECRTYETVCGPWDYFTVDDGQIRLNLGSYLMMGTLESYRKMREYYGAEALFPIYIQVEDGLRLQRALERERSQSHPNYSEMCRRFLADEEDFKEENLKACKIEERYENTGLEECLEKILGRIREVQVAGSEESLSASQLIQ